MGYDTFALETPAFAAGDSIPAIHTADGLNLSPPLRWRGEPETTLTYVLVLDDPDAPTGTWIHWLLFNIPATIHSLPTGLPRTPLLSNGASHGLCWGVKRFNRMGYQGPQPPDGATHHYRFVLRALDTRLSLPAGCTLDQVHQASSGHIQAEARLIGLYAREPASMVR
jgi:Raf kinase inhibitor-like YbhB/YbcL family protein